MVFWRQGQLQEMRQKPPWPREAQAGNWHAETFTFLYWPKRHMVEPKVKGWEKLQRTFIHWYLVWPHLFHKWGNLKLTDFGKRPPIPLSPNARSPSSAAPTPPAPAEPWYRSRCLLRLSDPVVGWSLCSCTIRTQTSACPSAESAVPPPLPQLTPWDPCLAPPCPAPPASPPGQQPALIADLGKQHAPGLNLPPWGAGMSWQWALCSIPLVAAYSKSGQGWRDLACRPQTKWPRVSWECCPKTQEIWNWALRLHFQKLLGNNSNSRGRITRSQELVTSPGSHQLWSVPETCSHLFNRNWSGAYCLLTLC